MGIAYDDPDGGFDPGRLSESLRQQLLEEGARQERERADHLLEEMLEVCPHNGEFTRRGWNLAIREFARRLKEAK